MSENSGHALASRQFSIGSDVAVCAICLDSLATVLELARPSACKHRFCRACLERMCRSNPREARCPLDRSTFTRYAVSKRYATGEVMHDVETLQPTKRLFDSPFEPLVLCIVPLLLLWLSPSWTLALHIIAISVMFWFTDGTRNWELYSSYAALFYIIWLPIMQIGLWESLYSWCCTFLILRWFQQLPELRSNEITPEKLLFFATILLLLLVCPVVLFSVYTLLMSYGYAVCLVLSFALSGIWRTAYGNKFAAFGVVFVSVLHIPYMCWLPELYLSHVAYYCAVLLYLTVWHLPDHADIRARLPDSNLTVRIVYCIAMSLLFGYSVWNTIYAIASLLHQISVASFLSSERGKLLFKKVPLLVMVYLAIIHVVLPWKLFGFWSHVRCSGVVQCTNGIANILLPRLIDHGSHGSQTGSLILIFLQLSALGIFLPAMLF